MARVTRREIIDAIVCEATKWREGNPLFLGDERDGRGPPITLENFAIETFRYGVKALRARLSRYYHALNWFLC